MADSSSKPPRKTAARKSGTTKRTSGTSGPGIAAAGTTGLPVLGPTKRGSAKASASTVTNRSSVQAPVTTAKRTSAQVLQDLADETRDPASRFDALTYDQAQRCVTLALQDTARQIVPVRQDVPTAKLTAVSSSMPYVAPVYGTPVQSLRAYVQGDHWQGGAGWAGPMPPLSSPAYQETVAELARSFVSRNVLGEISARHAAGAVGYEPQWSWTVRREVTDDAPITDEEQTLIREATALMRQWWVARKMFAFVQRSTVQLAWAGRSAVRLYIPRGLLQVINGVTSVVAKDVASALELVWADDPLPEQSRLAQDPDTKRHVGVTLYQLGRAIDGEGTPVDFAELTYRGLDDTTTLRTMGRDDGGAAIALHIGGRLTLWEMERPSVVTPQLIQQQRALNLALSMVPRTLVSSGFLERVILNAQLPGRWETDAGGNRTQFIPDAMPLGAGKTTILRGIEMEDEATGKTTTATPDVKWREPSKPDPVVSGMRALYEVMLEECNQSHVLMNQDAKASGKSRDQARAEFRTDVGMTVSCVQPMGVWLLETPLAMAEAFAGVPGKYTAVLKALFNCRQSSGPLTADEKNSTLALYNGGLRSRRTAMAETDVDDVDAELAQLESEPGSNISIMLKMATVVQQLGMGGADVYGAAIVAGFDEDDAELLAGVGSPTGVLDESPDEVGVGVLGDTQTGAAGLTGATPAQKPKAGSGGTSKAGSAGGSQSKATSAARNNGSRRAAASADGGKAKQPPTGDLRNAGVAQ